MTARLESGDVLLTTRMDDVFLRFRQTVMAGDAALAQLHAECVMVHTCEASLRIPETDEIQTESHHDKDSIAES
jgi:hypothetical protein